MAVRPDPPWLPEGQTQRVFAQEAIVEVADLPGREHEPPHGGVVSVGDEQLAIAPEMPRGCWNLAFMNAPFTWPNSNSP